MYVRKENKLTLVNISYLQKFKKGASLQKCIAFIMTTLLAYLIKILIHDTPLIKIDCSDLNWLSSSKW